MSVFVCLSGGSRGGWASWFVGAGGPCAKNRTFFGGWWFLALPPSRQGQTCQSSVGFVVFGPGAPCLTGPLGAGPFRVPLGLVVSCLLGVVGGGSVVLCGVFVGFVVCFASCSARRHRGPHILGAGSFVQGWLSSPIVLTIYRLLVRCATSA